MCLYHCRPDTHTRRNHHDTLYSRAHLPSPPLPSNAPLPFTSSKVTCHLSVHGQQNQQGKKLSKKVDLATEPCLLYVSFLKPLRSRIRAEISRRTSNRSIAYAKELTKRAKVVSTGRVQCSWTSVTYAWLDAAQLNNIPESAEFPATIPQTSAWMPCFRQSAHNSLTAGPPPGGTNTSPPTLPALSLRYCSNVSLSRTRAQRTRAALLDPLCFTRLQ